MKFGFVTCVQLGLDCLEAIEDSGGHVAEIYTLRDDIDVNKAGRVYLDSFAAEHGARLHKVSHVSEASTVDLIKGHSLDWLFIVGWSQIASQATLDAPSLGCIGIHPTLLPVGRGRAPIPWAIIKGLDQTGVTMIKLDAGVDSGPIIEQVVIDLASDETAQTLYERVGDAHRDLIFKAWQSLESGNVQFREQDEASATVWPGRKPEDGEISNEMTVLEVDRLVRGVTRPYPGSSFVNREKTLRIWAGQTNRPADPAAEPIDLLDGKFWPTDFEELQ